MTPEQQHDQLMDAIERELTEYGIGSLVEMIATMLEDRDDVSARRLHEVAYSLPQTPIRYIP